MPKAEPVILRFNAGEINPLLDATTDLKRYYSGCLTMENFIPLVEGPAVTRPGTYYVAGAYSNSTKSRLISFQFSTEQGYVLEFADQIMRVFKEGAIVTSAPNVPYELATPYLEADLFELKMVQSADVMYIAHKDYAPRKLTRTDHTAWTLNIINFLPPPTAIQNFYPVATLTLGAVTGTSVLCTASNPIFLGGDINRQIIAGAGKGSITTYISTTQVRIDITDTFASVGPIASQSWAILGSFSNSLTPDKAEPINAITTLTSTGSTETLTSLVSAGVLEWILSVVGTNEYYCRLAGGGDPTIALPDKCYENSVEMYHGTLGTLGLSQWAYGDNDALGFSTVYVRLSDETDPTLKADSYVEAAAVVSAASIFRSTDVGAYVRINGGFAKITAFTSATVVKAQILKVLADGIIASTDWSLETPVWSATLGYPGAIGFFEQRLVWAGSTTYPQTIWLSVSQDYENYTENPLEVDSAITYRLTNSSGKVDAIQWIMGENVLILGTTGGLTKFGATAQTDPLSNNNINAKLQKAIGVKNISAEMVDDAIVFVQRGGTTVRRIQYDFQTDKYQALDLTRLAKHITKGATAVLSGIEDMSFQSEPYPILWSKRADGTLLGMLYVPTEDMVVPWFRTVTDGQYESVAVESREGNEDRIWVSVKRTIEDATKRYIEYFKSYEFFGDITNAFCVDSGLTWQGDTAVAITGITAANPPVVTAPGHGLANGNLVRIYGVEGMTEVNCNYTQAYTVANKAANTFELSGIDGTDWTAYSSGGYVVQVANSITSGLSHLEGKTVAVVTDIGTHPQRTVSGGAISLNYYANKITVGLPYNCNLMPMKIEIPTQGGSSRRHKARIYQLDVAFYRTFGGKWGPDADNLRDIPFGTGIVPALVTDTKVTDFDMNYAYGPTILIRQSLPYPMTVLAIYPVIEVSNG